MVPNLIGNIPNWIAIKNIAKKYQLKIIEDSADTLGATMGLSLQEFIAIYLLRVFTALILLVVLAMVVCF